MKRKHMLIAAALLLLILVISPMAFAGADDVPRMDADELLVRIDSPDVAIVDVRREWDWKKSEGMIKNAVRRDFDRPGKWQDEYGKDKTIVLYCA